MAAPSRRPGHSRERGNPFSPPYSATWIPAFAGMTGSPRPGRGTGAALT